MFQYLILNDGKIINTNLEKKSTIFDFKQTNFDLGKFQTKTTTKAKNSNKFMNSIFLIVLKALINIFR